MDVHSSGTSTVIIIIIINEELGRNQQDEKWMEQSK